MAFKIVAIACQLKGRWNRNDEVFKLARVAFVPLKCQSLSVLLPPSPQKPKQKKKVIKYFTLDFTRGILKKSVHWL